MFVFLGLNTAVSLEQAEDLLPEKESPVTATAEGRAYLLVPQERGGTEEGNDGFSKFSLLLPSDILMTPPTGQAQREAAGFKKVCARQNPEVAFLATNWLTEGQKRNGQGGEARWTSQHKCCLLCSPPVHINNG